MKKKTDTATKTEKTENQIDYSAVLPLLCAALQLSVDTVVAYSVAPLRGHGFVYGITTGEAPMVGILDLRMNDKGAILPGSFGVAPAMGVETFSEILGFFERFAAVEVSRDEIIQLFEQE